MFKIGITGQNGFIGTHLYNTIRLYPKLYQCIEYRREFFHSESTLDDFVKQCDVIIHLAAVNRHENPQLIYQTNISLVQKLVDSLKRTRSKAHVLYSSSSQEEKDNPYGISKKEGRGILADWAIKNDGKFTGLVIPNVFGPFGLPNYNSFIATFCHRLTHGERPEIKNDGTVKLIYVAELIEKILNKINDEESEPLYIVPHTASGKVSLVLDQLEYYESTYLEKGEIPVLKSNFDLNLFNTYRSYIDYKSHFPVRFVQHIDDRGLFVEIIRIGTGGQISFSTTKTGIVRGNHYHTRKIERFAVIKGKALIQLRRIGTNEILDFELDGKQPAYVDIPIWYTHNIKNIGKEILYTNFWINEVYNSDNPDTYFEVV